ncbi:hypothetical protein [Mangrovimonas sp. YM274]|uniref:hypothetical protein n=1 Tax=Mangrovimonas sp. YM274 TaxID=3070660 RepID=UPI0027DB8B57|nr:hypothetical protein [Mangrovimonas sp. YM274]WMI69314.1 hypothetical protein RBH95_02800 [Mangrovimonas sp. YM274]
MTKNLRLLKWNLGVVLLTSLFCFYETDMIPLPLIIMEDGVIQEALSKNMDMAGIGTKAILIGQIALIWSLFSKKITRTAFLGSIAVGMLFIGIPMTTKWKNVHSWTFEFTTWIPFFISGLVFLYFSYSSQKKE